MFQLRFQALERICSIVLGLSFQMPKSCLGSIFLSPLVMLGWGLEGEDWIFIFLIFKVLSNVSSCSTSWIPDVSMVTVIVFIYLPTNIRFFDDESRPLQPRHLFWFFHRIVWIAKLIPWLIGQLYSCSLFFPSNSSELGHCRCSRAESAMKGSA